MASFNQYKHLFTPMKVGTQSYRCRIEFAPMVCDMTTSTGEPRQGYIDFVERQAQSGVAIIHLGATPINKTNAVDYRSELDITSEDKIQGLVLIAEAAHIHGAKISVELVHAGRGADPQLITTPYAVAPSNFSIPGRSAYIKVMDNQDIDAVIHDYIDCALRLQRCGFDGVLVHGAHGNLIAQFLSPMTNTRADEWGGSPARRRRFPLRLLRELRAAVGPDFIIELRISGDEVIDEGMHTPEVIDFLRETQDYIDIVNVSAGLIVETRGQFFSMPPYFRPRGANIKYARQIRQASGIRIPVMVAGGFVSAEMVERYIDEGACDGVSMARALLADPDMLRKCYRGQEERVRPCLRCWKCAGGYGRYIHCAVNPQLARTERYATPGVAPVPKKVVVVGGGVAGTMAARTLAQRGHTVTLFERSAALGGHLKDISCLPFKDDMRFYTKWLQRETSRLVSDIRLATEATAAGVMAENPDVIVVATGSLPARPPIPGLDREQVCRVLDVDSGRAPIPAGSRVVVCGGGLSGCESALALAMNGCAVKVVDKLPLADFARGGHDLSRNMLMSLLGGDQFGEGEIQVTGQVELIPDHLVREITDKAVVIESRDWQYRELEYDYVVDALGMRKNQEMIDRFYELIPDVYYIGDAYEVGDIMAACHSAYNRACNI